MSDNPPLGPGQFSLDGFVFGGPDDDIVVTSWSRGTAAVRDQDTDDPRAGVTHVGRDFVTPALWSWRFLVHSDRGDLHTLLAQLWAVWRPVKSQRPDGLSELRFRKGRDTWCVLGRPREIDEDDIEVIDDDDDVYREVPAAFKLKYALAFADDPTTIALSVTSSNTTGGIVLPARLPWHLAASATQEGQVELPWWAPPTPFRITFKGPTTGEATVKVTNGSEWTIEPLKPLKPGQELTVDTLAGSATWADNTHASLSLRSTKKARLMPGQNLLKIEASDASLTASATVTWREAIHI